jgi:hypothetical protein
METKDDKYVCRSTTQLDVGSVPATVMAQLVFVSSTNGDYSACGIKWTAMAATGSGMVHADVVIHQGRND